MSLERLDLLDLLDWANKEGYQGVDCWQLWLILQALILKPVKKQHVETENFVKWLVLMHFPGFMPVIVWCLFFRIWILSILALSWDWVLLYYDMFVVLTVMPPTWKYYTPPRYSHCLIIIFMGDILLTLSTGQSEIFSFCSVCIFRWYSHSFSTATSLHCSLAPSERL